MEIFKTSVGSWVYPEPSLLRLGGVPLFTGFMYAAIGSYIARCWRLFDFRFTHHPPLWAMGLLALGIYVNFFAHHYVIDARLVLFAVTALLLGRCWVHFKVWRVHRRMPLLLGFALVALFIWLAENIGTFTAAWAYPNQRQAWELVSLGKLGAWFLLMIISYVLVALVSRPQAMTAVREQPADYLPETRLGFQSERMSGVVIARCIALCSGLGIGDPGLIQIREPAREPDTAR
jgi:uncharacterized membrane protein YoaT (DUF817 family)